MQQNQKVSNSIFENQALREELAWKICSEMNKYLPEDKQFTQEEVLEWCNDPKRIEQVKRGTALKVKKDKRIKQASTFGEVVHKEFNIKINTTGPRIDYLLNEKTTKEAEKQNISLMAHKRNSNSVKKICQDEILRSISSDPEVYFANDIDEALDKYEKNFETIESGFNMHYNSTLIPDSEITKMSNDFRSLYEGNDVKSIVDEIGSPFNILIPNLSDRNLSQDELLKLYGSAKNIDEIRSDMNLSSNEFDPPTGAADKLTLLAHINKVLQKSMNTDYQKFIRDEFKEKGWFKKDLPLKKQLTLNGEKITTSDLYNYLNNEVNKNKNNPNFELKLPEGLELVDRDHAEIAKFENEKIIFDLQYKMVDYEKASKDIEKFQTTHEFDSLRDDINNKVLEEYNGIVEAYEASKDKDAFYLSMKLFNIKHGREITELDNRIAEFNAKVPQLEDDLDFAEKLQEQAIRNLDTYDNLSYSDMSANFARVYTTYDPLTDNLDINLYPENTQKVLKSGIKDLKTVKDTLALFDFKPELSEGKMVEAMSIVASMGKKDEEYQKRGNIGKWWYRNSHDKMMKDRANLIQTLKEHGVTDVPFDKLGKDKNIILALEIKKAIENQKTNTKELENTMEKIYNTLEKEPKDKMEKLSEREKDLKNELLNAKVEKGKIKADALKQIDKNMTMESFSKLKTTDAKKFGEITEQLKNLPGLKESLANADKSISEKTEEQLKVTSELNLRKNLYDKGIIFDEEAFNKDPESYTKQFQEPKKDDKGLQENLKNTLDKETNKLKNFTGYNKESKQTDLQKGKSN